ncbi:MAG: hypothetical protein LBK74_00200 [Treponema sp.]|jgi:hypothetical protein|nr:hypothetical protein [Treponema sp.]
MYKTIPARMPIPALGGMDAAEPVLSAGGGEVEFAAGELQAKNPAWMLDSWQFTQP